MKITKERLRQAIKEELESVLRETSSSDDPKRMSDDELDGYLASLRNEVLKLRGQMGTDAYKAIRGKLASAESEKHKRDMQGLRDADARDALDRLPVKDRD